MSDNFAGYLLVTLSAVVFLSLSIFSFSTKRYLIFYPSAASFLSTILFIAHENSNKKEGSGVERYVRQKPLDILIFTSIATIGVMGHADQGELSNMLLFIFLFTGFLIGIRTVFAQSPIVIFQMVLLAVVITSTVWFSAPILGKDNPFHVAFIGHIYRTGHIIPTDIPSRGYYHWYPIAHIGSAIIGLITGSQVRIGYYLFVGLSSSFVGLFVYLWMTRGPFDVQDKMRAGLLSGFFVTFSAFTLARIANLYAQTLGLLLAALAFYLLLRFRSTRIQYMSSIVFISLILSHNMPVLVVSAFCLFLIGIKKLYSHLIGTVEGLSTPQTIIGVTGLVVGTTYYYIFIGYILQFRRIIDILLAQSGLEAELSDKSSRGGMTTVFDAHHILSGELSILFFTLPLLILILVAGFALLCTAWQVQLGQDNTFDHVYIITSGIFLVIFMTAMYVGENSSHISRGLDLAVLFLSPIFGIAFGSWTKNSDMGKTVVLSIIVVILISALIYPGLMIPNRTQMFEPSLSQESVNAVDFTYKYSEGVVLSDSYTSITTSLSREIGVLNPQTKGVNASRGKILSAFDSANTSALPDSYYRLDTDEKFLIREYIMNRNSFSNDYISCSNNIYDAGRVNIISRYLNDSGGAIGVCAKS